MKNKILLLFFLSSVNFLFSQSVKELYKQGTNAYESKDYGGFLRICKTIDSIRPSHPTYSYNLACAYALNKEYENSFSTLEKCILENKELNFEQDVDLESLKSFAHYEKLVQLKKSLAQTVANSKKVSVLSEKELHPENIVYLKQQKLWLAASVRKRKIVSFDVATGICVDWFKDNQLLAVMALKTTQDQKSIWVCTSAVAEMEGYNSKDTNRSEVLQIDIATHQVLQRIVLEGNHVLGDLCVTATGAVYVTDSVQPIIYKVENGQLVIWLDLTSRAYNLQGIIFDEKRNCIFVADYLRGILKINVSTPSIYNWLTFPRGFTFKGIDGLSLYKNSLIVIQNGVNPIRIARLTLENGYQISKITILDHNRNEFKEPTSGCVVANQFYFIANVPWSAYDSKGNLDSQKISNPMLFVTKL
ncbi:hypothetical protein [Flavobacterium sp.]|uniref:hypothetical protein n=1 Tax=Flavobacterium sp. TaxID=239 RepID=UPI003D110287